MVTATERGLVAQITFVLGPGSNIIKQTLYRVIPDTFLNRLQLRDNPHTLQHVLACMQAAVVLYDSLNAC